MYFMCFCELRPLVLTILVIFPQFAVWTLVWSMRSSCCSRVWPGRSSAVWPRPRRPASTARCCCCLTASPWGSARTWCAPRPMSPVGSAAPPSQSMWSSKMASNPWGASSRTRASSPPLNCLWSSRQIKTVGRRSRTSLIPTKCWSWEQSTGWWRGSCTPLPVLSSMISASSWDRKPLIPC